MRPESRVLHPRRPGKASWRSGTGTGGRAVVASASDRPLRQGDPGGHQRVGGRALEQAEPGLSQAIFYLILTTCGRKPSLQKSFVLICRSFISRRFSSRAARQRRKWSAAVVWV